MTWPAKRITKTALWRAADPSYEDEDTRVTGVRKSQTRVMVRNGAMPARKAGKR